MTSPNPASAPAAHAIRRVVAWALVALWAGVIFWWSSKPGSQIPSRFPELGHLGEYLLFGALLYLALRCDLPRREALALAIVIASAYGIIDEFHQHFTPMRTPDVVDWGVDTFGAMLGATLAALALRMRRSA